MKLLGALAIFVLLGGCSADEPRLAVQAADCWGHADCGAGLASVRSALGAEVAVAADREAANASGCGPVVDCRAAAASNAGSAKPPQTTARVEPEERPTPRAEAPTGAEPPTRAEPPTPEPEVVAAAGSAGCEDISVSELEKAASLSPADVLCLGEIARGAITSADTERQIAAVALYNHKATGWPAAVEAALKRPSLRNAPALNFAGIKTAYDRGQYLAVVKRADVVWRNLEKGYQLSGSDKTFLSEFACRSAGQLALQGDSPSSGLDWCERWLARASSTGADTGPIQDLIDQLE